MLCSCAKMISSALGIVPRQLFPNRQMNFRAEYELLQSCSGRVRGLGVTILICGPIKEDIYVIFDQSMRFFKQLFELDCKF